MDGPTSLERRYLAPVRIDVGLYEVWKSEHRSLFKAPIRDAVTAAMGERVHLPVVDVVTLELLASSLK